MITFTLLTLAVLWFAAMHQYPSLFIPRKSARLAQGPLHGGENWIEVLSDPTHHEVPSMQEVS
jgi:hypothetical protein